MEKPKSDEISKEYSMLFNGITATIDRLNDLIFDLMVLQNTCESMFIEKEENND